MLRPGVSFGDEVALGITLTYRSTVTALEPTNLYLVEKDGLSSVLDKLHDDTGTALCDIAAQTTQHDHGADEAGAHAARIAQEYALTLASAGAAEAAVSVAQLIAGGMTRAETAAAGGNSDAAAAEAGDDDAEAAVLREQHGVEGERTLHNAGGRCSLVGGGMTTLPPGFADKIICQIDELHDEVLISKERIFPMDRRLHDLEGVVGKVNELSRDHHETRGRVERIERLLEGLVEQLAPSVLQAEAAASAASGRTPAVDLALLRLEPVRVRLTVRGCWLDSRNASATSDPYLRLCRLSGALAHVRDGQHGRGRRHPNGGGVDGDGAEGLGGIAEEGEERDGEKKEDDESRALEEFELDSRCIIWSSEVCRGTNNPSWSTVTLDHRALVTPGVAGETAEDEPLLLQCWDWDRAPPHGLIGACVTSLRELLAANGEDDPFALINQEKKREAEQKDADRQAVLVTMFPSGKGKGKSSYQNSGTLIVEASLR